MTYDVVVLMGSAGSGKGTQAERIVERFGYDWVETGGLIRAKSLEPSPLGKRIKQNDDLGRHAPDTIITCLLIEALGGREEGGYKKPLLIDGFPRTARQLEMLDEVLTYFDREPSRVGALWIRVPEDVARQRLLNRTVCSNCKKIFAGRDVVSCDRCGGQVKARAYDTASGIEERLRFFAEHTMPAIDTYRRQGRLIDIDGNRPVDDVWSSVQEALS